MTQQLDTQYYVLSHHGKMLAVKLVQKEREWYQKYDEDVDAWYRDPVNRGLSYPCCIHGMSNWTDYDNICGGCESGFGYFNYMDQLRRFKDEVLAAEKLREKRFQAMRSFWEQNFSTSELGNVVSESEINVFNTLHDWVDEPVKRIESRVA